ncbi:MAG TPA: hypothetical protein VKS79_06785 [Gemmataceae bacterium]|nr:hypothetical protein [Gemmataceae bacterium]
MFPVFLKPAGGARAFRWALFLFAVLPALAAADTPALRWQPATKSQPCRVELNGLDSVLLAQLRDQPPKDWSNLLAVFVGDSRTPILGNYTVGKASLLFEPRFPFNPGLKYRALFTPASGPKVELEFTIPQPTVTAATVVEQVYPSADKLPENLLKFYLHFSASMSWGQAYSRVHLLDADGKEVERPFLELEQELWDPSGRRLTLFIHPGRIKRGLKPREELGPVLQEGKSYTLVVDSTWPDTDGNPLQKRFTKEFKVEVPDETQPDPKKWALRAPAAGERKPLTVRFPKPLDHALLQRMLWIVDKSEKRLDGQVRIGEQEKSWSFTPAQEWKPGEYRLVVDTALEDFAGNSVARPFEVDEFHAVQKEVKAKTMELPFSVR